VTGDPIRLGLVTKKDQLWDYSFDLPAKEETSMLVNVHAHALTVLRTVALRSAQYIAKHQPACFFYKTKEDGRRHHVYAKLLQWHPALTELYDEVWDETSQYAMFTRK
jgi:hypothetical protein